jgi:hypothetical protein
MLHHSIWTLRSASPLRVSERGHDRRASLASTQSGSLELKLHVAAVWPRATQVSQVTGCPFQTEEEQAAAFY